MKSWHLQSLGAGLDGLQLREHDVPQPGAREVLVRVHACALNYREISILKLGRYPLPITPGAVALCDGAGEVVALGEGVSRVKMGERVIASIFPHWIDGSFGTDRAAQLGGSLDGMLTEYAVLPEEALVSVPAHLDSLEAAALPCAAATAWNALDGGLALKPGDDVLTLGSGGVSLLGLQLAKAAGARVIATTSSDDKAERLRALGADEVVNYRAVPEWSSEVRRLTQGQGVQHVVEVGGGATLPQSLKSVAIGGDVGFVGSVAAGSSTIDANAVFVSAAVLRAVAAGSRAQLQRAVRIVAQHVLKPVIARVFGFDEAPAALAWYAEGKAFGKTVIRVAP
jgi:NADPH:quinone reductase-like Zn-dependent oxidoreductase